MEVFRRIQVFGKVQGVFYRASTKTEADNLGIVGWVRNEPDGSVRIYAEGSKEAMKKFIAWCKEGPQFAKVSSLSVEEDKDDDLHHEFQVRY